jgi:tight adherence protein B
MSLTARTQGGNMRSRSMAYRTLWMFLTLSVLAIGVWANPSSAQDTVPQLSIRAVDARTENLQIGVSHSGEGSTGPVIRIDGEEVDPTSVAPLDEAGIGASVMVLIDNSESMGNGPVQITKDQLEQLIPGERGIESVGVVTIGGGSAVRSAPKASMGTVEDSLSSLAPTGGAALWDGVYDAAQALNDPDAQNNIIIVNGAADAGNGASFSEAAEAVRRAGASVHAIALPGGTPETGALSALVGSAGGTYQTATSNELDSAFGVVASQIDDQWLVEVTAPPTESADLRTIEMTWGDGATEVAYRPGIINIGADALQPLAGSSFLNNFFSSTLAKWMIVLLGTASAAMIVYAVGMLILRRNEGLDFTLRHYEGFSLDEDLVEEDRGIAHAGNEAFKKAVAFTGDMAERQGVLGRVEEKLERANLPLRPAEAVFFYVAVALGAGILSAVLFRNILIVAAVVIVAILGPRFYLNFRAKRRSKKFVAQLPDMLHLLSGTLRAGYSIGQGFEAVSQEIEDPMGHELIRVMAESRLGRPLIESLENASDRMESEDFEWAVMAIRIQREVGGNLAELLLTVADTMTQRERLRRDVSSLTAEGRISAIVLGFLPPGLAMVMFVMNPDYIGRLFDDMTGMAMLGVAVVAMLIGFAWMKKIIDIEI